MEGSSRGVTRPSYRESVGSNIRRLRLKPSRAVSAMPAAGTEVPPVSQPLGAIRTVLPARAGVEVPGWLTFLRQSAAVAAVRPVVPPRRLLLALPTSELAVAALAVGTVAAVASHRSSEPLDRLDVEAVGSKVSAFANGAYTDTVVQAVASTSATISGGTTMTTYADILRPLPGGFPDDRRPRKLKTEGRVLSAWATAGLAGANAARLHARCSATPVVLIAQQTRVVEDLECLEEVWPQVGAFVDAGRGLSGWFRHPLLICDARTEPLHWLLECKPSLVVCDGAAAWRSQLRRAFPDAAHVLVIDRRSPAAVDLVDEICAGNPTTQPFKPDPPAGIEGWRIEEPPASAAVLLPDDEDLI